MRCPSNTHLVPGASIFSAPRRASSWRAPHYSVSVFQTTGCSVWPGNRPSFRRFQSFEARPRKRIRFCEFFGFPHLFHYRRRDVVLKAFEKPPSSDDFSSLFLPPFLQMVILRSAFCIVFQNLHRLRLAKYWPMIFPAPPFFELKGIETLQPLALVFFIFIFLAEVLVRILLARAELKACALFPLRLVRPEYCGQLFEWPGPRPVLRALRPRHRKS